MLKIDARKVKRLEKYDELGKLLFEKVSEMRSNYLTLSVSSIRRMGFDIAKNINLLNFRASNGWMHKWKKTYRIGSRKVTKCINKNQEKSLDPENLSSFRMKVKEVIHQYELLLNTDESGLNYEISRGRTMSHIGEKQTPVKSISSFNISHSYTFQPTVCSNGILLPKMMIILQESSGHFGPRVKAGLSIPPNIFLQCTRSGKSTNDIFNDYISNVIESFQPSLSKLLLVDSWSGHTNVNNSIDFLTIPPGTTSLIQPLDRDNINYEKFNNTISQYVS
ncbi:hypothetical protein SNEBB_003095 [Seison nebaliae]|nr:hypothetical protein SNEBB_003095 [Seison nebaliae]